MRVVCIDIATQKPIIDLDIDAITPVPGDLIATPSKKTYRVMQRAFILEERQFTAKLTIGKPAIEVVLQIAVTPVDLSGVSNNAGH